MHYSLIQTAQIITHPVIQLDTSKEKFREMGKVREFSVQRTAFTRLVVVTEQKPYALLELKMDAREKTLNWREIERCERREECSGGQAPKVLETEIKN
jgi:hypothetical protein